MKVLWRLPSLLLAVLLLSGCAGRPPSDGASEASNETFFRVGKGSIYDIRPSQFGYAMQVLRSAPGVALTRAEFSRITGQSVIGEPEQLLIDGDDKFVLLRSKFGTGPDGYYEVWVSEDGRKAEVLHLSEGEQTGQTDSAVIVRLSKVPVEVSSRADSWGKKDDLTSWLKPPPKGGGRQWNSLPQVLELESSKIEAAMSLLESTPAVALTSAQAQDFIQGRNSAQVSGQAEVLVLVRALFGHAGTGRYSVSVSDDGESVVVHHSSMGGRVVPTRSALVLRLKKVPKNVYSSISLAE